MSDRSGPPDAVLLRRDPVILAILGLGVLAAGWYLVGSDLDWCRIGRFLPSDPLELFRRSWPFPEAGVNSIRSEIVVAALAEDVFTGTGGERQIVRGGEPPPQFWGLAAGRGWRRVIGFREGDQAGFAPLASGPD